MKLTDFVTNPPMTLAIIVLTVLLFWGYGCPPQTKSLLEPDKKVTRPELQIELDSIVATAQFRLADLDRQEQFRDIIFNNAMVMVETGTLNPIGIMTMLAGLYGVTRGAKDIKDRVKKKTNSNT